MIYGGDLQLEWKESISLLIGADRFKYYGGVLVGLDGFAFGYSYGLNHQSVLNHFESHQISAVFKMADFHKPKGR